MAARSEGLIIRRNVAIALALALGTTSLVTLATGANFLLDASGLNGDAHRQRAVVSNYERQLRQAKQKLEEVRSRQAVEQAQLLARAKELQLRSERLDRLREPYQAEGLALAELRLGGATRQPGDLLVAVETSLKESERRQMGDVARLGRHLNLRAHRLAKLLKMHGVSAGGVAAGGPLIALKGSAAIDERMAAFERARERYETMRGLAENLPQGSPVPGSEISSRFGSRRDPINGRRAMHGGLDFRAKTGTPVRSTAAGRVKFAGRRGGYGKLVVIDHGNGITTRYGHLSRIHVSKGERVSRATIVGKVGSTGRSTGPHLHYEVRRKGQVRDPAHYVQLERALKSLL